MISRKSKYLPVHRIGQKILSEERVSIFINTIAWIRNLFFFLLTWNLFLNKHWLQSHKFWCVFFHAVIGIYKITEPLKYLEKNRKKTPKMFNFHTKFHTFDSKYDSYIYFEVWFIHLLQSMIHTFVSKYDSHIYFKVWFIHLIRSMIHTFTSKYDSYIYFKVWFIRFLRG